MQLVRLITLAMNQQGVYGGLVMNDSPLCVTVERPWLDNQANVSCVPRGTKAHFKKYQSPHNGLTWITQDFRPRTNIEIHAANVPLQVEGCCGVGQYFAVFAGIMGVANAGPTMNLLRRTLPDEFDLVIQ